jgi:hypothetical protein
MRKTHMDTSQCTTPQEYGSAYIFTHRLVNPMS